MVKEELEMDWKGLGKDFPKDLQVNFVVLSFEKTTEGA